MRKASRVDVWGIYGRETLRVGSGHDYRVEVRPADPLDEVIVVPVVLDFDASAVPRGRQELLALASAMASSPELREFDSAELARTLKAYRQEAE